MKRYSIKCLPGNTEYIDILKELVLRDTGTCQHLKSAEVAGLQVISLCIRQFECNVETLSLYDCVGAGKFELNILPPACCSRYKK